MVSKTERSHCGRLVCERPPRSLKYITAKKDHLRTKACCLHPFLPHHSSPPLELYTQTQTNGAGGQLRTEVKLLMAKNGSAPLSKKKKKLR